MSSEQFKPERPVDSVPFKNMQLILMFREVGEIADPKLRNEGVTAWIDKNGKLFDKFFNDDDRGYEIIKNYEIAKEKGEDEKGKFIDETLQQYAEWRASRPDHSGI